jgi:hypothetical protein
VKRHAPEESFDDMPLFTAAEESEKRAARARAEIGMVRAATRAEVVRPGWHVVALAAVRKHAEQHQAFLAESVDLAIPSESDPRAAGVIFREAARRGWIVANGYAKADSEQSVSKNSLGQPRVFK